MNSAMRILKKKRDGKFDNLLSRLVDQEARLNKLPALNPVQRAKLDTNRAIDHLYYSSKIEGTHLSEQRIERAMNGNKITPIKN